MRQETTNTRPAIELRGVTKRYGARAALDRLNLTLPDGLIVGIVGPDGAGKTTLVRLLAGLLELEAERATVLGFDLRGDVTELKRQVGYVPQAFSLHRELSVLENLKFTARLQRIPSDEFDRLSVDLLRRTGLAPFVARPAGALSGGMKQKLAVANALLARPRLLLLDEPTAGVDVTSRAELWSMLEAARSHALVVISTSYLDEAEACDELLYLDSGRVIAQGPPHELRASVPIDLYRVWSDDPRAVARSARRLPYVEAARRNGGFARVEVLRPQAPNPAQVREDLAQGGSGIHLIEQLPADMESTLLHFAKAIRHSPSPQALKPASPA